MKENVSKLKNIYRVLCICIVITFIPCMITGCRSSSHKDEKKYYLYYINKNETKLEATNYYTKATTTKELVEKFISSMNETSSEINNVTALPSSVKITNWNVEDSVLYIDFTQEYLEMKKTREILCRSAIVLTMAQIYGIDYVSFTIKGEPLADSQGKSVGNMKATDFIDNSGSTINSYENREAIVYFADSKGEKLVPKTVSGVYSTNTSMEKFIIEQLQKGCSDDTLKRTIPADVKLNSISTKDGICYVNFDGTFLSEAIDISYEAELYSIVNSLCELSYVNKVQISINGETNKVFHDKISLKDFFVRNLDIVDTKSE